MREGGHYHQLELRGVAFQEHRTNRQILAGFPAILIPVLVLNGYDVCSQDIGVPTLGQRKTLAARCWKDGVKFKKESRGKGRKDGRCTGFRTGTHRRKLPLQILLGADEKMKEMKKDKRQRMPGQEDGGKTDYRKGANQRICWMLRACRTDRVGVQQKVS